MTAPKQKRMKLSGFAAILLAVVVVALLFFAAALFSHDPLGCVLGGMVCLVSGSLVLLGYAVMYYMRHGAMVAFWEERPEEVLSPGQRAVARATGAAMAYAIFRKPLPSEAAKLAPELPHRGWLALAAVVGAVAGASTAAALATFLVERGGVLYWAVVGVGAVLGCVYGVWNFGWRTAGGKKPSSLS